MLQRNKKRYFSQFGEDIILEKLLKPHQTSGFYIDIGAFHPFKYSNTALMHMFGWRGINIDANKNAIEVFNRVRPTDKNIYAAITETDGEIEFFIADKLGEVNTLSDKHREKWRSRGVTYKRQKVPSRRLDSLLGEYIDPSTDIDFMNIDVEDAEMGVLNSNDWTKYRPKVIAIEIHSLNENAVYDNKVAGFLKDKGYEFITYRSPTAFFQNTHTKLILQFNEDRVNKKITPVSTDKLQRTSGKKNKRLDKILFVLPGIKGGAHGIHAKFTQRLAEHVKSKGIETEIVSATTGDFIKKIVEATNEPKTTIYAGPFGYDLRVQADMNLQGSIYDLLEKKVFGYIADHPYTQFMWSRMAHAGKNVFYITGCKSLKNEFKIIFGNLNQVKVIDRIPPKSNNALLKNVPSIEERKIDLIVPLGIHKHLTNNRSISQELSNFDKLEKKVGTKLYIKALYDYSRSVFENFQEIYKEEIGSEYVFSGVKRKQDQLWLSILSKVDWFIRRERRLQLLNGLKNIHPKRVIVITASPKLKEAYPQLRGENIHCIGEIDNDRLDQLYLNSKHVLNCNPTYPDGVHGRIRSAMISGAKVVSDTNPVLEEIFSRRNAISILSKSGKELGELLEHPVEEIQNVATTGRQIIQKEFNISDYVDRLITVLQNES